MTISIFEDCKALAWHGAVGQWFQGSFGLPTIEGGLLPEPCPRAREDHHPQHLSSPLDAAAAELLDIARCPRRMCLQITQVVIYEGVHPAPRCGGTSTSGGPPTARAARPPTS